MAYALVSSLLPLSQNAVHKPTATYAGTYPARSWRLGGQVMALGRPGHGAWAARYGRLFGCVWFSERLSKRWRTLRAARLSTNVVHATMDAWVAKLTAKDEEPLGSAAARNWHKWPVTF